MTSKYLVALIALLVLFVCPTALDSCLIGEPEPVFMTKSAPADPRAFFEGRIGVVMPSYGRPYLIGAYGVLSGRKFSREVADAMLAPRSRDLGGGYLSGLSAWRDARRALAGTGLPSDFYWYKSKEGDGVLFHYQNCLDDAFSNASSTLTHRMGTWGAGSPKVKEWLAAQDLVFANCSGKVATIPAEPTPEMDALQTADRQYQIAAAHFYAGQWEEARRAFRRVAENRESPWRGIAPYLIGRVYLREGMVDEKPAALQAAEREFTAITEDPSQSDWHDASLRMLDFTGFRLHAWERLTEYAAELVGEGPSTDIGEHLRDFLFLFDHATNEDRLAATSELADWMLTFTGRRPKPGAHALEQWRKSRNNAWLMAALAFASQETLAELLPPARAIKRVDPAYDSAAYYGMIAAMRSGRADLAREWAEEALKGNLQVSSRNRILSLRIKLARTFTEFLRSAPRRPEADVENYDGGEISRPGARAKEGPMFDADSAAILNRDVPLLALLEATRSAALPARLQMQVAQAGFTRSIILGRAAQAKFFMQRAVELNPALTKAASEFLSAANAESARFAGVLLFLRTSGPSPLVPTGVSTPGEFRRSTIPGSIRWGVHEVYLEADGNSRVLVETGFLTPLQRKQADLEWTQLKDRGSCGATFAETEAIAWAIKHPEDGRVPEALYYTVRATFKGCRKESDVGKISRQAYDLLKQRYPNSEWATKTKYWYK